MQFKDSAVLWLKLRKYDVRHYGLESTDNIVVQILDLGFKCSGIPATRKFSKHKKSSYVYMPIRAIPSGWSTDWLMLTTTIFLEGQVSTEEVKSLPASFVSGFLAQDETYYILGSRGQDS